MATPRSQTVFSTSRRIRLVTSSAILQRGRQPSSTRCSIMIVQPVQSIRDRSRRFATSINAADVLVRSGKLKFLSGKKFPRGTGYDFTGDVVEVGSDVSDYKVGDAVWGFINYGVKAVQAGARPNTSSRLSMPLRRFPAAPMPSQRLPWWARRRCGAGRAARPYPRPQGRARPYPRRRWRRRHRRRSDREGVRRACDGPRSGKLSGPGPQPRSRRVRRLSQGRSWFARTFRRDPST